MSVKSVLLKGKLSDPIFYRICDPDSDIRNGIWVICLEKVIVKFVEDKNKYFSFCIKTNLVDQTKQDEQGRVNKLNTCLGVFSCKGTKNDEVLVHNVNQTWFPITVSATELYVFIENPFTGKKLNSISETSEFALYFLYKRIQ
jgi:hypothetical protein